MKALPAGFSSCTTRRDPASPPAARATSTVNCLPSGSYTAGVTNELITPFENGSTPWPPDTLTPEPVHGEPIPPNVSEINVTGTSSEKAFFWPLLVACGRALAVAALVPFFAPVEVARGPVFEQVAADWPPFAPTEVARGPVFEHVAAAWPPFAPVEVARGVFDAVAAPAARFWPVEVACGRALQLADPDAFLAPDETACGCAELDADPSFESWARSRLT